MTRRSDVLFVTNFCPHYRVGAFEQLANRVAVRFYFFSDGKERYWEKRNPIGQGKFEAETLAGFNVFGRVRIPRRLLWRMSIDSYEVMVKCTNGLLLLFAAYALAQIRRKKFILWQTIWYLPRTLFHRLAFPLLRFVWFHADAIVTYGLHGRDYLVGNGVAPDKIFVAPQAVDNARFDRIFSVAEKAKVLQRYGLEGKNVILYVGQLIPVKGIEYLLEAYAKMQTADTALVLIGDGPLERELRAKAGGMQNVSFLGYVDQHEIVGLYAIASVFVLPSVSLPTIREAWGLVVNEAMNQGCPVVVTDAVGAGVGGLVANGKNGFVVPERNPTALAEAIHAILSDPGLAARLGEAARTAVSYYDHQHWANGFVEALKYVRRSR